MNKIKDINLGKIEILDSDNKELHVYKIIYNACINELNRNIPEYNYMIKQYERELEGNRLGIPKEYNFYTDEFLNLYKSRIEENQQQLKRLYCIINNINN